MCIDWNHFHGLSYFAQLNFEFKLLTILPDFATQFKFDFGLLFHEFSMRQANFCFICRRLNSFEFDGSLARLWYTICEIHRTQFPINWCTAKTKPNTCKQQNQSLELEQQQKCKQSSTQRFGKHISFKVLFINLCNVSDKHLASISTECIRSGPRIPFCLPDQFRVNSLSAAFLDKFQIKNLFEKFSLANNSINSTKWAQFENWRSDLHCVCAFAKCWIRLDLLQSFYYYHNA